MPLVEGLRFQEPLFAASGNNGAGLPWANFQTYACVPLRKIRKEFGIRAAHFVVE